MTDDQPRDPADVLYMDMPARKLAKTNLYNPGRCKQLIDLMGDGRSIKEAAKEMGVSHQTIHNWAAKYDEFGLALELARERYEVWWTEHGIKNLYNKGFNAVLWYMNMKNRHGWKDSAALEHTGKAGVPIEQRWSGGPPPMTIAQWEQQVKEADGKGNSKAKS